MTTQPMTLTEALAYLTPRTNIYDAGAVMLTAGKMREAVGVVREELLRREQFIFASNVAAVLAVKDRI